MDWFTPLEYLMIDIANQFGGGIEKHLFKDRIEWAQLNCHQFEAIEDQALPKTKFRYAAAVMAYRKAEKGEPIGYRVGLDASASGPQIMSALMRDPIGAANTSLIGNVVSDVYLKVTDTINLILNASVVYARDEIKKALMTKFYGSKKEPEIVFGEDTPELEAFNTASAKVCPGAAYLMPILMNSWNPYADEHYFVLPDVFEAHVKVSGVKEIDIEVDELGHLRFGYRFKVIEGTEKGVANVANPIQGCDAYLYRELCRRCSYSDAQLRLVHGTLLARIKMGNDDSLKMTPNQRVWLNQGVMSLVGVEYINMQTVCFHSVEYCKALLELIETTLERPSFPVVGIHDEFTAHPNYMNWVRLTYQEIIAEMSDGTLIDDILSKLYGQPVVIQKMSKSISKEILDGNYAIG